MFSFESKILIVDDMPGMRKLVRGILRELGFKHFMEADNGKTGLDLIRQEELAGAPFTLIFCDWNMPVMRGIDLLRELRSMEKYKDVPFFLVTAEQDFNQVKEAISLRVNDYIVKPFTKATLRSKLENNWKKLNTEKKA